jgi:hypothetical protein
VWLVGRYWQRVFSRFGDKVVVIVVEDFPPAPLSWLVYQAANFGSVSSDTWWREAHAHSVALGHIVAHSGVVGHPFLLVAGDADEVRTTGTHAVGLPVGYLTRASGRAFVELEATT